MLRQIIPCTDPRLKAVSVPVDALDDNVRMLVRDLFDTTKLAEGAGMAAIQIGVPVRVFVMDLSRMGGPREAFINPVITWTSETTAVNKEGCLSMPGVWINLERPTEAKIEYLDLEGTRQSRHAIGHEALAIQHEMDHLDGIRNIDRLSTLKRAMAMKRYQDHLRNRGRRG
jgi:peptide deformylase